VNFNLSYRGGFEDVQQQETMGIDPEKDFHAMGERAALRAHAES